MTLKVMLRWRWLVYIITMYNNFKVLSMTLKVMLRWRQYLIYNEHYAANIHTELYEYICSRCTIIMWWNNIIHQLQRFPLIHILFTW